jgi:DNA-binding transcriptional LysR family regulator
MEGNLTRAAERLYITQPSVSHAIKQLEETLGIALFHRHAKGVRLTDEGRLLFANVSHAYLSIESAERHIAEINHLIRGELRIGSSDSLCKYYLLPHLSRFCLDHPDIRLDLAHGTTPEIVRQVKEGRIDFGIIRLPLTDDSLHIQETILVQDCFVAGGKFAHLADCPLSLAELCTYPLILFTKTSSSRAFIERLASDHGLTIRPEIELASVDLLIEFAKAGLGISFVTKQFILNELNGGTLFEVPLIEQIPPRKIGVIFLKNRRQTPATTVFTRDYLQI